MIYVIWCDICHQVRVDHHGDSCGLCQGTIAALMDPIVRPPLPHRAPAGVRFLHWLTGRTAA